MGKTTENDIAQKQLIEAISTFRTQYTLAIQILSLLVLSNITVLGWAITQKTASIFLLGSIIPLIFILFRIQFFSLTFPIMFSAYSFEKKIGNDSFDWLATTFLYRREDLIKEFDKILQIDNSIHRRQRLLKTKDTLFKKEVFYRTDYICLLGFLFQVLAAAFATHYFCWTFI